MSTSHDTLTDEIAEYERQIKEHKVEVERLWDEITRLRAEIFRISVKHVARAEEITIPPEMLRALVANDRSHRISELEDMDTTLF